MTEAVKHAVATDGPYDLYRANDDLYFVYGPDPKCSGAWLQRNLPDGDWLTEWMILADDTAAVLVFRA